MATIGNVLVSFVVLVVTLLNRFHNKLLAASDARLDRAFFLVKEYKKLKLSQISDNDLYTIEAALIALSSANQTMVDRKDVRAFYVKVLFATIWTHALTLYEIEKSINIHHMFKEMFGLRTAR